MKKKELKEHKESKNFSIKEVSILLVVILLIGIFLGVIIGYNTKFKLSIKKYSNKYEEIIETYQSIVTNYYDEVDEDNLIDSAVKGMIENLNDDYSAFIEESDENTISPEDDYIGIGCGIVLQDDKYIINEIYKDTPASKLLKENDVLLTVNNKNVENLEFNEVTKLIRGKEKTKVKLKVLRENKEVEVTLKRAKIKVETITSNIKDNIGIINIETFNKYSAEDFKTAIEKLENKNIKSLVIDVRGNNGGYLSSVNEILSMFLEKGTPLYQLEKRSVISKVNDKTKEAKKFNVVILVNKNTASSAEILASTLSEQYNAKIVGETTYGKDSVQKVYNLKSGSQYKYTIEKWKTSKGGTIAKTGIKPDVEIKNNDDTDNDEQLEKALELLKK